MFLVLLAVAVVGSVCWQIPKLFERGLANPTAALPTQGVRDQFISAQGCKDCHPKQHASWHKTFHRTMTQEATTESVVGDFDNVVLEFAGVNYRLETRGDEFWVHMPDMDWLHAQEKMKKDLRLVDEPPMVERQIVMTTGSHHFQGYWVASEDGDRLRQLPFYYHIDEHRWIPKVRRFLNATPPEEYDFTSWNFRCIQCHTTGGSPGYDKRTKQFATEVADLGISCEACHGPGQGHMQRHRKGVRDSSESPLDDLIVDPQSLPATLANDICGRCHSVTERIDPDGWLAHGDAFQPGQELEESQRVLRSADIKDDDQWRPYWTDGKFRCGGREYNAVTESACFNGGEFSCLSCHSMHESDPDGLMRRDLAGNQMCLQCHEDMAENLTEHTHHSADSTGSQCQNCHMPHTSFALLTALPSHHITAPTVAEQFKGTSPNACNLCHLDQTLQWTGTHLADWYGMEEPELDEDQREIAASLLWLLKGDGVQRTITGWHFGWQPAREASGHQWMTPFLVGTMNDDFYTSARYVTGRALRTLPQSAVDQYDFLGTSLERRRATTPALSQWKATAWRPEEDRASRLLLNPDGSVKWFEVERLRDQQDRTAIHVPE